MNERLSQLASQLSDVWKAMPPKRRLIMGGSVAAVFLALVALSLSLNRGPVGDVLFSRLSAVDAAEVLMRLDERGIAYRVEQDGAGTATILVPPDVVYRTRIDLAAEGIPRQGSVGFEIFDESQLGMTDDVRRINLRRALSGELERTIRAIDVIEDARVQLALPENKLFISQQQSPTAAVMVTLRPGRRLSADQVRAIQRLVGATVEGLDPADVFVADNRGNPLSDQLSQLSRDNGMTPVEQQILIEQAVSSEYARQLRSMLEGPFGAGKVEAMVKVDLNFEMTEEIIKAFEAPNGNTGIIRSEQRLDETFQGEGAPFGGVPGVESNVPGYPGMIPTGPSSFTRLDEIINYEINETEVRRVIPPGAIRRVSVAVLIDGELTDAEEEMLESTITTALGLNPLRGDQVSVDSLPFFAGPLTAGPPVELGQTLWGLSPPYALTLAALLALIAVVYLRQRRRKLEAQHVDIVVGDDDGFERIEREATPEERRRQQVREQLIAMTKEQPQEIAQLLKGWLTEE